MHGEDHRARLRRLPRCRLEALLLLRRQRRVSTLAQLPLLYTKRGLRKIRVQATRERDRTIEAVIGGRNILLGRFESYLPVRLLRGVGCAHDHGVVPDSGIHLLHARHHALSDG